MVLGKFYPQVLKLYPKLDEILSKKLGHNLEPLDLVGISSKDIFEKIIEYDYKGSNKSPLADLAYAVDTSMYELAPNSSILNKEN
jgi:hypothetical protein